MLRNCASNVCLAMTKIYFYQCIRLYGISFLLYLYLTRIKILLLNPRPIQNWLSAPVQNSHCFPRIHRLKTWVRNNDTLVQPLADFHKQFPMRSNKGGKGGATSGRNMQKTRMFLKRQEKSDQCFLPDAF